MVTLKNVENRLKIEACKARLHEQSHTREAIEMFLKETKVSKRNICLEKDYALFNWESERSLPISEAVQEVQLHDGWTAHRTGSSWILQSSDHRVEFRVWDSDQSEGTLTVREEV